MTLDSNTLTINNKSYPWNEITIKLSSNNNFSPGASWLGLFTFYSSTYIVVYHKDICVEEILCNVDAVDLFDFQCEDFFNYLQETQYLRQIDKNKYQKIVQQNKLQNKKLRRKFTLMSLIIIIPLAIIILFTYL
jgi:hypothetical protein